MMTGTMMNGIDTRKEKKQKKEKELKSYEGNSKILRALSEFKNIVLLGADMIIEGIDRRLIKMDQHNSLLEKAKKRGKEFGYSSEPLESKKIDPDNLFDALIEFRERHKVNLMEQYNHIRKGSG